MQKDSKFFDDLARMASGAASELFEMKKEIENMVSLQVEKLLQKSKLATKEEYETLVQMVAKLRTEQEEMKKKLESLELTINRGPAGGPKSGT